MGSKIIKNTSDKVISIGLKNNSLIKFQVHNSKRINETKEASFINLM